MGRKNKKPNYEPEKIQKEMIAIVKELYAGGSAEHTDDDDSGGKSPQTCRRSLRAVAEEVGVSLPKVVKLLITGGVYTSEMSEKVIKLYDSGKSIPEIQAELGVCRATVHSYLPYKKGIYSAKETSINADRIRLYRERNRCLEELLEDVCEERLWDAVTAFQKYPFYTASGLKFEYELKKGRNGHYNKELLVSRRKESKTLAWSSVVLAFNKALEMQGQVIERPKALGDIRGISYIYPMLYRFGIIEVPEKTAAKMQLRGGWVNRKAKEEKAENEV